MIRIHTITMEYPPIHTITTHNMLNKQKALKKQSTHVGQHAWNFPVKEIAAFHRHEPDQKRTSKYQFVISSLSDFAIFMFVLFQRRFCLIFVTQPSLAFLIKRAMFRAQLKISGLFRAVFKNNVTP